ncbi:hypothetical protein Thexy_0038 [Thermoanaerobacterium xylanolyticum LX-11]|uniref:HEAT domain containing protein n=1 Tax=Thermoanaerobacterium xylanolyticum (strain ATCC 49914 / DSM 7097 / LX-11) TaxID=858215 RepID=F6BLC6_THEXL|nr:hypothetical protein [Thermoanaerobacterium xylanolyticum]AEF16102.1 hypothetical protein Thexy_0038 [Thermoanaerobacterium xylanolyticum LX-11]
MQYFQNFDKLTILRKNDKNMNNCSNTFSLKMLMNRLLTEESKKLEKLIFESIAEIRDENFANLVVELLESNDAFLRDAGRELLAANSNSALKIFKKIFSDFEKNISLTIENTFRKEQFRNVAMILREVIEHNKVENVVAVAVEYLGKIGKSKEDKNIIKRTLSRFSSPFFKYITEIALKNLNYYNEVN